MPAAIHDEARTEDAVDEIAVFFSEEINIIDANAPANYELRAAVNGVFGDGDDIVFDLVPEYTFDPATGQSVTTLTIVLQGGVLAPDRYRLTVRGGIDASIKDIAGNRLDGNDDGTAGGDYVRVFLVGPNQPAHHRKPLRQPRPGREPREITLTASGVDDPDGEVVRVEFYRDTNGNGIWDPGDHLLGYTLEGVGGQWILSGVSTAGWSLGEHTLFARAMDNEDAWSDAAVTTIVVDQIATTRIDMTIVHEPSAIDDNGEGEMLPGSEDWVHEWQSFWVEIWVSTPDTATVGRRRGDGGLAVQHGLSDGDRDSVRPGFTKNLSGTIDDALGRVVAIGGQTDRTDVGDDAYVLLARVRFGSIGDDQVPSSPRTVSSVPTTWKCR
jgi:hypothetical protein